MRSSNIPTASINLTKSNLRSLVALSSGFVFARSVSARANRGDGKLMRGTGERGKTGSLGQAWTRGDSYRTCIYIRAASLRVFRNASGRVKNLEQNRKVGERVETCGVARRVPVRTRPRSTYHRKLVTGGGYSRDGTRDKSETAASGTANAILMLYHVCYIVYDVSVEGGKIETGAAVSPCERNESIRCWGKYFCAQLYLRTRIFENEFGNGVLDVRGQSLRFDTVEV